MREYVVSCRSYEDLQSLYDDMETEGGSLHIPNRAVELVSRREISRNTHYRLTDEEADLVRQDERVLAVDLTLADLPHVRPGFCGVSAYEMHPKVGDFTKDSVTDVAEQNNLQWGHLHSAGTNAQRRKGSWSTGEVNDTVEIFNKGKHVDVVVVDGEVGFDSDEWLSLDTGQSRFVQYDWYANHTIPGSPSNYGYPPVANAHDHGMHVAGTIAGKYYGWAPEANIYNISFTQVNNNYIFDVIREFHKNKPINPVTGVKNPTICNNSWGYFFDTDYQFNQITSVVWNGTTYSASNPNPSGWTADGVSADFGIVPNRKFGFQYSSMEYDIQDLINDGVVMVSAAGNSNHLSALPQDPEYNNYMTLSFSGTGVMICKCSSIANAEGAIAVGALDTASDFRRTSFSNFGPRIDVFAPGRYILSVAGDGSYSGLSNLKGPITRPGYPALTDKMLTISGTSMACPQVAGIAACLATGRTRLTTDDILGYIHSMSKTGDMTFDVSPSGGNYYFLSFNASSTNDYTVNGTDVTGSINGNDPTITIEVGDVLYLSQPAGGSFSQITGTNGSSDYTMVVADRLLDGSQGAQNDPTINIEFGDGLDIQIQAAITNHPIYLRDSSNTDIPNVYGQGSTAAFSTIGWAPADCPPAGTYKYICDNHSSMTGSIIVHPAGALYNHPLYIKTALSSGTSNQVASGVTGQGATNGNVIWDTTGVTPGTYYYQCGIHSNMNGQIVVNAKPGVIGQAGNFADPTCSKGSPNREIFCENPRNKSAWKGGWKKDTLNGRRRTEQRDQYANRQVYPRVNSLYT